MFLWIGQELNCGHLFVTPSFHCCRLDRWKETRIQRSNSSEKKGGSQWENKNTQILIGLGVKVFSS